MTKINCLEQSTAAIMIFRMMVDLDEKKGRKFDLRTLFNMPELDNNVDVKLTVNGVEVDPIKCLESCWDQLDKAYENRALGLAKQMITVSGFDALRDKLQEAEWEIANALETALEKLKGQ